MMDLKERKVVGVICCNIDDFRRYIEDFLDFDKDYLKAKQYLDLKTNTIFRKISSSEDLRGFI